MVDVYGSSDAVIRSRIGERLKSLRLKQNITQQTLAEEAGVSLSSIKKIEKGEIGSFDSWLRVLRTLGKLDILRELVDEEEPSPSEYYEWVHSSVSHMRKRAAGKPHKSDKEEEEW